MSLLLWAWLGCVAATPEPDITAAPTPVVEVQSSPIEPVRDPMLDRYAFVEAVSAGADPGQPLPLIIAVHGLGDRPQSFTRILKQLPFAARIVAPLAPTPHGAGGTWYQSSARSSVSSGQTGPIARQMRQAASEFVPWMQAVARARPTVGKPVLTGFSQGAMMSYTIATHHGHAIEKAVPLSGWMPPELIPLAKKVDAAPIVAVHGTADDVLPLAATQASVDKLQKLGHPVHLEVFDGVGHTIGSQVKRRWFSELQVQTPAK